MHYNNYKAVFDRTMLSVVCVIALNNPQPKYNQCRLIVVSRLPAVCVCVCWVVCFVSLWHAGHKGPGYCWTLLAVNWDRLHVSIREQEAV